MDLSILGGALCAGLEEEPAAGSGRGLGPVLASWELSSGAVGAKGHFPDSLCALSSAATRWHSGCGAGLG